MRRISAPLLSLALVGIVHAGGGASASAAAPIGASAGPVASASALAAAPVKRRTAYAFNASGFGSQAIGGDIPVSSGKTAFQRIGCTNLTGLTRTNFIANVDVPDSPFSLSGVETSIKTRAQGTGPNATFSSTSLQEVADLNLVDSPLGTLSVSGLTSLARTSVKDDKFSTATDINIAGIAFTPLGGEKQELEIPAPNETLTVPGVAEISLGKPVEKVTKERGLAFASALQVRTLFGTNTRFTVAQARSSIDRGVRNGVFSGFSTGVEANALDGIVRVGRNPLRKMPCQGTRGDLQQTNLANVNLSDQVVVKAARAEQKSSSTRASATGFERGSVAALRLGGDALVVKGVVGKATVTRTGTNVVRKADGGVGSVTADGEVMRFPRTGVLRIPGVASLEQQVVTRTKTGLQVIGVQITLLDGTGATIDLGKARMEIRRGLR